MVSTIEEKISESKDRFKQVQDDLNRRFSSLREELWRRQAIATGRLRDESLQTAYGLKGQAFDQAAELLERVPSLDKRAKKFRNRAAEAADAQASLAKPPIEDYDDLNVQKVTDALEGLDAWALEKVRIYEESNKGRVTVLRAVSKALGDDAA